MTVSIKDLIEMEIKCPNCTNSSLSMIELINKFPLTYLCNVCSKTWRPK